MLKAVRPWFFVFLAGVAYLDAQVERASIIGNVSDKSGAALASAQVLATNDATNTSVIVTTDTAGAYTILNLIPGKYTVTASQQGFAPVTNRGLELQVTQQARLDLTLQLGTAGATGGGER